MAKAIQRQSGDQDAAPLEKILITILIPTRNRRHRVGPLVSNLIANWPADQRSLVEIVVLNNRSTDGTKVQLSRIKSPMLRVINTEEFYPTSEENVFAGIRHARGEFVWFLGDDDIPRLQTVKQLIALAQADAADFFVFNFRVVDELGRLATVGQVRGAPANYTGRLADIIKRIGMINMLSGWSIIVARRSMLDVSVAYKIREVSPIYSHCFWFLSCFSQARSMFVANPLVDYRVFHAQGGWKSYTEQSNVGYLYYWHLGLLRLMNMAMKRGLLTARDISEIFEYRHNGTKYRAINEITFKLIEQAGVYVATRNARELLSPKDLEEAISTLLDIDLTLGDVCLAMVKMYDTLRAEGPVDVKGYERARVECVALLMTREGDLYEPFFIAMVMGYCIYNYGGQWIGVRVDALQWLDSVFSQFKPRAMPPGILVGVSRASLLRRIYDAPPVAEPVGERPSLDESSMLHSFAADNSNAPVLVSRDAPPPISQVGVGPVGGQYASGQMAEVHKLNEMVSERDEIAVKLNDKLVAQAELERTINKSLWRRLFRKLSRLSLR